MHSNQTCRQHYDLLSWCQVCGVPSKSRGKERQSGQVFKHPTWSTTAEKPASSPVPYSLLIHWCYIHINSTHMSFSRSNGPPLFVAPINQHNAAFLNSVTEPITEYACPAATVPLNSALWHCRLAHHNLTDVKVLIEQKLVTRMQLDVKTVPNPLCEPCLASKMHANLFPSSSWRASQLLELVHSDVHAAPYLIITTGSHSSMIVPDTALCTQLRPNWTFSMLSSSLKRLQRPKPKGRSKHCEMTRKESIWAMPCSHSPTTSKGKKREWRSMWMDPLYILLWKSDDVNGSMDVCIHRRMNIV